MKRPLVSIIVPVYNVEKYLPECLESLLAQTYPNFELLFVDDGSPDGSWKLLQEYSAQDSRVRVFQKENGGVSSARNFGLEQAKGEYIGFVDPDDRVAPQYLEWLLQAVEHQQEKLVICGYRKFWDADELQQTEPQTEQPESTVTRLEESRYDSADKNVSSQCWRALYKRELVEAARFREDISIGEDTLFFLDAFLQAERYVFVDAKLYFYRLRDDSAYRQTFHAKKYTELQAWEMICEKTKDIPGPLHRSAQERMLVVCASLYYKMLDAHWPDKAMRKSVQQIVWENRHIVRGFKAPPRWKNWSRRKLLSMLYLPDWFNGPVWHMAEQLRAKRSGVTEYL